MATHALGILSGSTHGMPIKLTTTVSTSAATIHTAVTGTTNFDLITLYAHNQHTADLTVTIGLDDFTNPDDLITMTVRSLSGPVMILDRYPLRNSLVMKAWASTANLVMITGTHIRVTV